MCPRPLPLLLLALLTPLACGGSPPPEPVAPPPAPTAEPAPILEAPASTSAEPPAAPEPPPAPPAPKTWKDMGRDERIAYMKETVTPRMMALFQEHDAKEFKTFNCATCHGPGVKEGKFDMPNPALYRLLPFDQELKKHPKDVKFMAEKVVPVMAELLGEAPYDPSTQQGFGCARCHTSRK